MTTVTQLNTLSGKSYPVGATISQDGVNFCVYSLHATGMDLVLFESEQVPYRQIITLDPDLNRTYSYWHIFVPGIKAGQRYGFRVHGPNDPESGLRFDGQKLLIDPYSKAVAGWDIYDSHAATAPGGNLGCSLRSVVVDTSEYDWSDDSPPRTPFAETVIYEMHVGGFTRHPNSGVEVAKRGTFAGLIEKIPYLKNLGITAIELMPVHEFDMRGTNGVSNYWGYSTVSFFAPHHGFCVGGDTVRGVDEFRDMVKAMHRAGIEVILDVVFNHTAEGSENGPTICFRGFENSTYYLLDRDDRSSYSNYAGCGNSFNCNHPVVGRLVLDSLRYWVTEMHVDGFRFDLAAALARDVYGRPLKMPPLLWSIECDPALAGTKLIAEAWDAAGLYRVGWFVNTSNWYAEWNGPYRDDVRKFIRGDAGMVSALATRLVGSSDLYQSATREPNRSINFITCHDGFTLRDLTSYNTKHNEANNESNRDGMDANYSWNCGVEGESHDADVLALRKRQMKNMITTLFSSQGTPMILMGDEVGRTQSGNNNAYCHDDELSWFNWELVNENADLLRFMQNMISFTQSLETFRQRRPIASDPSDDGVFVTWHGVKLNEPDWGDDSHALAFSLEHKPSCERLHVIFNSFWESLEFELPACADGREWKLIADTALPSPQDIQQKETAQRVSGRTYAASPRSAVILIMA